MYLCIVCLSHFKCLYSVLSSGGWRSLYQFLILSSPLSSSGSLCDKQGAVAAVPLE